MIRHITITLALGAAALASQAAAAASPDAKLWNGTWHLNAAASKWGAVGKEQSETRTYDVSGGKLTMNSTGKDGTGKDTHLTYTASCDGKVAPMTGSPRADSISLACVSAREIDATSSMKGKVTVRSKAVVSADGKHLTLTRTYAVNKGTSREVLEFTR